MGLYTEMACHAKATRGGAGPAAGLGPLCRPGYDPRRDKPGEPGASATEDCTPVADAPGLPNTETIMRTVVQTLGAVAVAIWLIPATGCSPTADPLAPVQGT